ncbi:MAG: hypothetical protein RJQ01_06495 [Microcella sp.]|uniref:hypothetical protein n=1 Tax=Microcella sp. TaxID=1913979 RepID=UPI0033156DD5
MEKDPLYTTLDSLRTERADVERRAVQLRDELESFSQRLSHLNGAIDNIEALLGVASEEDRAVLTEDGVPVRSDEGSRGATARTVDFSSTTDPEPPLRKRVPSTDWVAEVVESIGHPADRDTIYAKFEEMKGIPASWVSNPRNSFNNALGRAVVRRMIDKHGDDVFAPINYNPFRDMDSSRNKGQ